MDMPAGIELDIALAPANSTSAAEAVATFENLMLMADEKYLVVANGIASPTGYNPSPALELSIYAGAREEATMATQTDAIVMHGSTDAPTVDVEENILLNVTVIDDLSYGEYSDYLELPTIDLQIDVTDATGETVVATYGAPLATLGLQGAAIAVVASGFLNPDNNSGGAEFGLWVALPTGGALIPLPLVVIPTVYARAQVIHNCADAAAAEVDVYLNGEILLDDFAFRSATPFVDVPAETEISIAIAPATSMDVSDAIATFNYTLTEDETYVIIATGIVSATGYNPAPDFNLAVYAGAREAATVSTNADILVYHGCTDAPAVDVNEVTLPAAGVVNNLPYGSFAGYLSLSAANDYGLEVQDETGTVTVGTYAAPLNTLMADGAAITLFASGFLNPGNNSNGPSFEIWAALANGTTLALPTFVSVDENGLTSFISMYPNPCADQIIATGNLLNSNVQIEIVDANGRVVKNVGNDMNKGNFNRVISTTDLENGIYSLRLTTGTQSSTSRFVVFK
jgi:hypothetical protein